MLMNNDIISLLKSKEMCLPKTWDGGFFPEFIRGIFNRYIDLLESLDDRVSYVATTEWGTTEEIKNKQIKDKISLIKIICERLQNVLVQYYNGKPYNAYKEFENIMERNNLKNCIRVLRKSGEITAFYSIDPLRLYRVRVQNSGDIERKDIFHLPLQYRTKASSCRYSIPGYPCLYLGTSIYGCWDELGRKKVDSIIASKFNIERNQDNNDLGVNVIDFGYRPQYLSYLLQNGKVSGLDMLLNYLVTWPLLASCSIVVKHKKDNLKPEYIVPQIFLQWLRNKYEDEKTLYGIRYFSCSKANYPINSDMYYNYVFPIGAVAITIYNRSTTPHFYNDSEIF